MYIVYIDPHRDTKRLCGIQNEARLDVQSLFIQKSDPTQNSQKKVIIKTSGDIIELSRSIQR